MDVDLIAATLLAGLVGFTELIGRYRSDPVRSVLTSVAAMLYVVLNAAAGLAALLLIRAFDWDFGQTAHVGLWQVLVAGFGAIAFFRTSLFVTRVGDENIGVGPSLVLRVLLDACDRQVDRRAACQIADDVAGLELPDLDPARVMDALPVLCLALMQNFPVGDQALLGAELARCRGDGALTEPAKMQATVIALARHLGVEVVEKVLTSSPELFKPSAEASASPSPRSSDVDALIALARTMTAPARPPDEPAG